jgi:class 3 adenylate cyclase
MREHITNFATINGLLDKRTADPPDSNTVAGFMTDVYNDFPPPRYLGERSYELESWAARRNDDQEVSFTGIRQSYCVCYIDMMNSTNIASQLKQNELGKYYSIFLNATATIARNFGAKIIKNAGDCLIYYFPNTSNITDNTDALKDVVECGITMISAHGIINAKLHEEKLPSLNYRISADYGTVELAKSKSSQSEDLFGSAMNLCAKINSKAPANGMVVDAGGAARCFSRGLNGG